jgi:TatA/E family protein of Tat protein translocase
MTKKEKDVMAGLSPAHLLIILVIALIVIGPGKLPEVGGAIGKSFREFQKAIGTVQDGVTGSTPQAQAPQAQAQAPAQPYYPAQPAYPAPGYQAQPGYPPQPAYPAQPDYFAPVAQQPMQYQPVMGVVEPVPGQAAPTSYPQQNGTTS